MLGFYDSEENYLVDPGEFQVFIGLFSQTENNASFALRK